MRQLKTIYPGYTESEIINLIKKGDKKAIHSFKQCHNWLVYSISEKYQKSDKIKRDIYILAFEGLIEAAKQFDGTGDFKSFAETFIRKSIESGIEEQKNHL